MLLGIVGLHDSTEHLLRRLAGRQVLGHLREVVLAVLDPTGRAGGDHGQSATVLNTAEQLVGLLYNGQVGGHVHIEHTVKAQTAQSSNHLTLAVGAGLVAEALADLCTNGGSSADIDLLGGIAQSLEYLIGIVLLMESTGGASHDALTAVHAGGGVQRNLHGGTDHGIKATVVGTDHADALHIAASSNTATAQNALAGIAHDRGGGAVHAGLSHCALEAVLVHAVLLAESLQLAGGGAYAGEALLIVVGDQQLQIGLAGSHDLGRVGDDLHALADGVYAGGDHTEGSAALGYLNKAQTASADLVDLLQIAKSGDVDAGFLSGIQNGSALGGSNRDPIDFQIYHIHYCGSPS